MSFCRWSIVCTIVGVFMLIAFVGASFSTAGERSEILIGASLALSGSMASHGRDMKWAYEKAAGEINARGGIFVRDSGKNLKIRLLFEDNAGNPLKTAATVEKLVRIDKVDMLLGASEPTCVLAGCMAAEKLKTYYHTSFGFPPELWQKNKFNWSTDFFFALDQYSIPFELLNGMDKKDRPRKLAVVAEGTFVGEGFAKALSSLAKKYGYETALVLKLPVGAKDYSSQIAKVKQSGAEAMLLLASVEDTENFVRGLKKNNVNVPYIHTWKGAWPGTFWKDLGKDAQYIICDGHWSIDYPFEGSRELGQKYYETFGEYSVFIGLPYSLAKILFEAIEKAGSVDGAKVRQAVLANTFKTLMGEVKYNKAGLALYEAIAAQWWDGKQMLIYPSEYAVWKVKLAPPWDKR